MEKTGTLGIPDRILWDTVTEPFKTDKTGAVMGKLKIT
jgi:hypothetical protein